MDLYDNLYFNRTARKIIPALSKIARPLILLATYNMATLEERMKPQEIKTAGITLLISKGKVSKKKNGKTKKAAAFGCRTT